MDPTDFESMTIMREARYVMNCKPLGQYLGDEDDVLPIRPIDLVTGFLKPSNEGILTTTPRKADELRRCHNYTKKISCEWWDRWIASYLPLMQQRLKWTKPHQNFQKGDAVLLLDDTTPTRGRYSYALVVDTKVCKDGLVRSATVKTSDGLLRQRDIRKLVLLEPADDMQIHNDESMDLLNLDKDQPGTSQSTNDDFGGTSESSNHCNDRAGKPNDDASTNVNKQRADNQHDDVTCSTKTFHNQRLGINPDAVFSSAILQYQCARNQFNDGKNPCPGSCSERIYIPTSC